MPRPGEADSVRFALLDAINLDRILETPNERNEIRECEAFMGLVRIANLGDPAAKISPWEPPFPRFRSFREAEFSMGQGC